MTEMLCCWTRTERLRGHIISSQHALVRADCLDTHGLLAAHGRHMQGLVLVWGFSVWLWRCLGPDTLEREPGLPSFISDPLYEREVKRVRCLFSLVLVVIFLVFSKSPSSGVVTLQRTRPLYFKKPLLWVIEFLTQTSGVSCCGDETLIF